jgi:Flp pilus assembly protein CpaB
MNTKLFLIAVVIVAAFGIAAMVGPATIATQAVAQKHDGGQCKHDGWELYR